MAKEEKNTQECAICGTEVDAKGELRAYEGYVCYYVPGRAGILHRHNLSNWSSARKEHITPTENRRSKNGKKGTVQAADSQDVTDILTEIGEKDSAVARMLVVQALNGSANALREILGKRAEAGQGERFEAFRRGEGACPTCELRPIWTLQFSLGVLAEMRGLTAALEMAALGKLQIEQTRSATAKQPTAEDMATYEEAITALEAHQEEEARNYPMPPVTSNDGHDE